MKSKRFLQGRTPLAINGILRKVSLFTYMSGGDNPAGNGGHSERWDSQSDSFWQREIQASCEVIFI